MALVWEMLTFGAGVSLGMPVVLVLLWRRSTGLAVFGAYLGIVPFVLLTLRFPPTGGDSQLFILLSLLAFATMLAFLVVLCSVFWRLRPHRKA